MIKILSIDGGGIRGLVPLTVLYVLTKRTGIPVYKMFDIITGTSTGAIIAGMLAIGIPIEEIINFYMGTESKKIFSKGIFNKIGVYCPKYDNRNIEEVLQNALKGKTFKDCLTNLVIPADDWANRQGRIFSSFEARTQDIELWQAIRSSSAAETYFKAYNYNNESAFFDGGLYGNNPTDIAIVEAVKCLNIKIDDLFIVSLGTGTLVEKMAPKEIEKFWWNDFAKHLIPEIMDRITSKTHDLLSKILKKDKYFRLQFDCPEEFEKMDNVDDKNLQGLKNLADDYISSIWKNDINNIINSLKFIEKSDIITKYVTETK